jgi:hypothetical protein
MQPKGKESRGDLEKRLANYRAIVANLAEAAIEEYLVKISIIERELLALDAADAKKQSRDEPG